MKHHYHILFTILLICLAGCSESNYSNETPSAYPNPTIDSRTEPGVAATQTPSFSSTPEGPSVSPYIDVTVTETEIIFKDTLPIQVELIIHGTLPDQCTYDYYSVENRQPGQVKITLRGIHPAKTDCEQTSQNITYSLLLGQDLPENQRGFEPGSYLLIINDYQTTFTIEP